MPVTANLRNALDEPVKLVQIGDFQDGLDIDLAVLLQLLSVSARQVLQRAYSSVSKE